MKTDRGTLIEALGRHAERQPERPALQILRGDHLERIPYHELHARVSRAAGVLREAGIAPGDRVALYAEGSPEWAQAYLAIHFAGAVVVPIDAQYNVEELANLCRFAGVRALILDDAHRQRVREHGFAFDATVTFLLDGPAETLFDRAPRTPFEPEPRPDADPMSLIFTSGTTGEPKGVPLTCGNIRANVEGVLDAIQITHRDNILNVLPLHHAYACTVGFLLVMWAGGTVTFAESLKGPDLARALKETGVTVFLGVPQLFVLVERGIARKIKDLGFVSRFVFNRLLAVSRSVRQATGLRLGRFLFGAIHRQFGGRLRFLVSGGARFDPDVATRLMDLGFLVLEGYGLTETAPVLAFTRASQPRPGSVGQPLSNVEARIHNPNEQGEGELRVRGPNVMAGYYRNDTKTAEVFEDDWFCTGDLARMDSDGVITITGRAKDVIVLPSGKNIYPEEIEARYQEAPFVKEIAILQESALGGAGHGLCAIVVPDLEALAERQAAAPMDRVRFELRRRAAELPSYMALADVVPVEGPLPRTRLGKLRRHLIAEDVVRKRQQKDAGEPVALPPETKALLEHPAARRFLERLAETAGITEAITTGQDLQMDLGIDSLTQMQLTVILEQEFGVQIPPGEVALVRTVGDVLERVVAAAKQGGGEVAAVTWSAQLATRAEPPLAGRYTLDRGPLAELPVLCARGILHLLARTLFRARVEGAERLPAHGPLLLCPTHQSYLDAVLIYALLPWRVVRRTLFLAFAEFFERPPLSWFARAGRIIKTGNAAHLTESLRLCAEGLEHGMNVCIFPEGALTLDGEIAAPRPGAGILACERGAPVYPIHIDGAIHTLSRRQPKLKLCRITIRVGDPIAPPSSATPGAEDYAQVTGEWRERVARLKDRGVLKHEESS